MIESILFYLVRTFGFFVRCLPKAWALNVGRGIGLIAYYTNQKHKSIAYANLKQAYAKTKTSDEIKNIVKEVFKNYGQNFIELILLSKINPAKFEEWVEIEGKENVEEALKQGKGLIMLAMHFGSWEIASISCAMLNHPYKVLVKPQKKFVKLDNLLNSYRTCGGSVILSRGFDTRELIRSLKNNEIVGMVADQGGRDGVLVPFLGRNASMSVGGIKIGLKFDVPVCFSIIIRKKNGKHRLIIHKPMNLSDTGNVDEDIKKNLSSVMSLMEGYINQYPADYMWFYKIWKYSNQSKAMILSDGRLGHLRQSQKIAQSIQQSFAERNVAADVETVDIQFQSKFKSFLLNLACLIVHPFFYQGRMQILKSFVTPESYQRLANIKTDFIISCGSQMAGLNHFLAKENNAKSIVVQEPGVLPWRKFHLLVLPQHDVRGGSKIPSNVVVTKGSPNLIDENYLSAQAESMLKHYSHLKNRYKMTIGVFIGGESKKLTINEQQIKLLIDQLKEICDVLGAQMLITTSRRTPARIDQIFLNEINKDPRCPLLIIANRHNIPEAVGGIMGLAGIIVVSGDSISMVSEAASSGKKVVVFPAISKTGRPTKHHRFVENLHNDGYVVLSDVRNIGQVVMDLAKNKIQTKKLNDHQIILEAARKVI